MVDHPFWGALIFMETPKFMEDPQFLLRRQAMPSPWLPAPREVWSEYPPAPELGKSQGPMDSHSLFTSNDTAKTMGLGPKDEQT